MKNLKNAKKSTWLLASFIIPALLVLLILVLSNTGALSDELLLVNNSQVITSQFKALQKCNTEAENAFTKFLDTKDLRSRIQLIQAHRKIKAQQAHLKKRKQYIVLADEYTTLELLLAKMVELENANLIKATTDSSDISALAADLHVSIHSSVDSLIKRQETVLQQQVARTDKLRTEIIFIVCGIVILLTLLIYLLWRTFKKRSKNIEEQEDAHTLTKEETDLLVASDSYKEIDKILSSTKTNMYDTQDPVNTTEIIHASETDTTTDLLPQLTEEHLPDKDYEQTTTKETEEIVQTNLAEYITDTNTEQVTTNKPENIPEPESMDEIDNIDQTAMLKHSINIKEDSKTGSDKLIVSDYVEVRLTEATPVEENTTPINIEQTRLITEEPVQANNDTPLYNLHDVITEGTNAGAVTALKLFLKETPVIFRSMQLCVANGNMLQLFKTIQTFKGSLSTFHMYALLDCINNLEAEAAVLKRTYTLNSYITTALVLFEALKPLIETDIHHLQQQ